MKSLIKEIRLKTNIFAGNTSIERILSELIVKKIPKNNARGLIIGYGQSGKLIAKILNTENNIPLYIANRKKVDVKREGLDEKSVKYLSFNKAKSVNDITFCIIALNYNKNTKKIVSEIINKIKNKKTILLADITTPALINDSIDFINISYLSKIANKNIQIRVQENNRVRKIIKKQLKYIVDSINLYIGREYIKTQKNLQIEIDKEKIDLAIKRNKIIQTIRSFLHKEGFLEVTTPYIVGFLTDPAKVDNGGVIKVDLRNGVPSFLRQSNQIYKQILIISGMKKIYEIGPFWRKEESDSYRHLLETIGLDIEMRNPEKLSDLYGLACEVIKNAYDRCSFEKHLIIPKIKNIPVLTYQEAIELLKSNGEQILYGNDLGLVGEMNLGRIIYKKYNSHIFIIKNYPDTIKKFYAKDCGNGLTETFDIILDGWEVVSGAIRQTNASKIRRSMMISNINIQDYEFYISLVNKAVRHGGFGMGIDRLVAKILNLNMVQDAVLFPRTYKKLIL